MHSLLILLLAVIMAGPKSWQTVTVESKRNREGALLIGAMSGGETLYLVNGPDVWELKEQPDGIKVRVISIRNVKGICTGGAISGTSGLLLYQELNPEFPIYTVRATIAVVDLKTGRARTLDMSHIFGPVKDTRPGRQQVHVVIAMKARPAATTLGFLWMTQRWTMEQSEFNLEVVEFKKAIDDFDSAWKERVTLWRTGLPFIDEPIPADFTWDSKETVYFMVSHDRRTLVVPYASSRKAKGNSVPAEIKSPRLIDLDGKAGVAGFSRDGGKFLVYDPAGKQVSALELPTNASELTYAGSVGGIVCLTLAEGAKTSVFWLRLNTSK
jgi:hypothetical protein